MLGGQLDLLVSVFGPDQGNLHWWQVTARGVAVFLICVMLIRMMCRRAFGMQSYLDIALAVLIGSILGRAVTGTAPFIGTTIATTGMAACYWALVHLAQRFHIVGWLVKGSSWVLVRDGEPDECAMRRVGISRTDLQDPPSRQAGEVGDPGAKRADQRPPKGVGSRGRWGLIGRTTKGAGLLWLGQISSRR